MPRALRLAPCLLATIAMLPRSTHAQTCVGSEPGGPHSSCVSPLVIPGDVGQHVRYVDATASTGAALTSCAGSVGHVVWFEIVPEASGPIEISTCHPATTYDTALEVWRGGDSNCDFMTLVGCSDDDAAPECDNGCSFRGSTVGFDGIAGERYRFSVGAYDDNSAGCSLCLGLIVSVGESCGAPPRNLDCALAQSLPTTLGIHELFYDVRDAFRLPNEPDPTCVGPALGHTVWFELTPPSNLNVEFSTCHSNTTYDTVVDVLTGDCGGVLQEVACNDDAIDPGCTTPCDPDPRASMVAFEATGGETYYFQVGSYDDNVAGCSDLCLGVRLTLSEIVAVGDEGPAAPAATPLLEAARPNPATRSTRIRLRLEHADHVTLDVVDVSGRIIDVLLDRSLPAGTHAIDWDATDNRGRDVGRGVYWVRLRTRDGHRDAQRVVILR
jgi:hypothetical protein